MSLTKLPAFHLVPVSNKERHWMQEKRTERYVLKMLSKMSPSEDESAALHWQKDHVHQCLRKIPNVIHPIFKFQLTIFNIHAKATN